MEAVGDLSEAELEILRRVKPFTLTSTERLTALLGAIDHVVRYRISGDIAECGVWKGGSMMAVALRLIALGDTTRRLYLYDTFEGMSEPTNRDRALGGAHARELLEREDKETGANWCFAGLAEVERNMAATGYPEQLVTYVRGPTPVFLHRIDYTGRLVIKT